MQDFSHLTSGGEAKMVNVGDKPPECRTAVAEGRLICDSKTLRLLQEKALPKGDVLAVARVAGILGAKKTPELIPLCHQLPLEHIAVDFSVGKDYIAVTATARTTGKTGVEMEALTAVSIATLTLYDMMKAVDKTMSISELRLVTKEKFPAASPAPETPEKS